jgi:3-oxoacyl-[acyl-carrier-protein] synthase II
VLAINSGEIPATINYEIPDPNCPVNVIHKGPQSSKQPVALSLNQSRTGQTAAVVIAAA